MPCNGAMVEEKLDCVHEKKIIKGYSFLHLVTSYRTTQSLNSKPLFDWEYLNFKHYTLTSSTQLATYKNGELHNKIIGVSVCRKNYNFMLDMSFHSQLFTNTAV